MNYNTMSKLANEIFDFLKDVWRFCVCNITSKVYTTHKEPPNQVVLFCTKELVHGLLDLIYLIMNNSIAPISM